jgi:lipopolysaccharide transport system ATP-binding protein
MKDTVIKVERISKLYRLGEVGTGTISHDLNRWWARMRGKEDPFSKVGESNDRTTKGNSDYVWALQNISFEIKQGDAVGIIGRNGAGKSTLLKILSRTTLPTGGDIKLRGRVASLLEVGTGFHPELTGRENIYLNGAILGMKKAEIDRKFDEIVDFAGVERYVDTPVKRYSSGMYVRLAFGVAAHLESEILIVDEVLAVGDAEFQKKCLGKMKDVSTGEGRTVLFVSHNMLSIAKLCSRSILLDKGMIDLYGNTDDVINRYNTRMDLFQIDNSQFKNGIRLGTSGLELLNVYLKSQDGDLDKITIGDSFEIHVDLKKDKSLKEFGLTLILKDSYDSIVFSSIADLNFGQTGAQEHCTVSCRIPANFLNNIVYKASFIFYNKGFKNLYVIENVININLNDSDALRQGFVGIFEGAIRPELEWRILE